MCMFCRSFFVLFLLAIVLSVILRYTDSDYPFGIFKLFLSISWQEQITFRWDEVHFVLKKHDDLDFHWAYSLKQQSMDRHIAPLGHIILNPSPPVFALTPSCCVLYSRKTANTKFVVIVWPDRVQTHNLLHSKWTPLHPLVQSQLSDLTGFESMIYSTRSEHHYTHWCSLIIFKLALSLKYSFNKSIWLKLNSLHTVKNGI